VHVDELVQPGVLQGGPVEPGEVQDERVGDEDPEGDQREGQHPGDPAVQDGQQHLAVGGGQRA
jgi:hypothetical protein